MKYEIGDRFRVPSLEKLKERGITLVKHGEHEWLYGENKEEPILADYQLEYNNKGYLYATIYSIGEDKSKNAKNYICCLEGSQTDRADFKESDFKYFDKLPLEVIEPTVSQKLDICRKEIAESLAKAGRSIVFGEFSICLKHDGTEEAIILNDHESKEDFWDGKLETKFEI